ncbi:hypothetical protein GBAR_LOCUS20496 [Geodia barretti]|uniref:Uncharacterized protein n=1 Tax=Geodia barretti TaxID=519541 RepID=A0AA35SVD5_GEOBA|nr:hypothetical protein GBAR_LOCUS20496 [Geodia barretti]
MVRLPSALWTVLSHINLLRTVRFYGSQVVKKRERRRRGEGRVGRGKVGWWILKMWETCYVRQGHLVLAEN